MEIQKRWKIMKKTKCEHAGGGIGMMDGTHISMMLRARKAHKYLGLTEEQKDKMKKIFSGEARKTIKSDADVKTLHLDLMELMREPAPDSAKIDSKIDQIAAVCAGMAKSKIHAMQAAIALLTPEQKEKWMDLKDRMELRCAKIKKLKLKNEKTA